MSSNMPNFEQQAYYNEINHLSCTISAFWTVVGFYTADNMNQIVNFKGINRHLIPLFCRDFQWRRSWGVRGVNWPPTFGCGGSAVWFWPPTFCWNRCVWQPKNKWLLNKMFLQLATFPEFLLSSVYRILFKGFSEYFLKAEHQWCHPLLTKVARHGCILHVRCKSAITSLTYSVYENGQRLSASGAWPRDAVTGVSGVSVDTPGCQSTPLE